eukprot:1322799-Amphidinium_carterae.1
MEHILGLFDTGTCSGNVEVVPHTCLYELQSQPLLTRGLLQQWLALQRFGMRVVVRSLPDQQNAVHASIAASFVEPSKYPL